MSAIKIHVVGNVIMPTRPLNACKLNRVKIHLSPLYGGPINTPFFVDDIRFIRSLIEPRDTAGAAKEDPRVLGQPLECAGRCSA